MPPPRSARSAKANWSLPSLRQQSRLEWALLVVLVVVPAALAWRFASPSFYFHDDLSNFYFAYNGGWNLDYIFGAANGHFSPGLRLAYLIQKPIDLSDFELSLAFILACHAASTLLLQRILQLVFGRIWWTYALALAWAISVIYLPTFAFFSNSLLTIASLTATLASIHGYLCWRATGRRAWLVWSLGAMVISLGFYIKALLIPLYLLLMRVLLLEPETPLRDSVRAAAREWRVWLAYAGVGAAYLVVYALGDYQRVDASFTLGDALRYARVFWLEGFWPMVFGVRVRPFHHEAWHVFLIVASQALLIALITWSLVRRREAWRAWAFLLAGVAANLAIVIARVSQFGPDAVAYYVRYYAEAAVLVPLALAFAFAAPGPRRARLTLPTLRAGAVTVVALAAYVGVTLATTQTLTKPTSTEVFDADYDFARANGRPSRTYFENLLGDLDDARRSGQSFSLFDNDVPEPVLTSFLNILSLETGVHHTSLSTVLPLFGERVAFNQVGRLYVAGPDGSLERARFVPAAGGSVADLRRSGRLRAYVGDLERRGEEWCLQAGGRGAALQWELFKKVAGRDLNLRARYSTRAGQRVDLESNPGLGWQDDARDLPAMNPRGTATLPLGRLPTGPHTVAGVRLVVPPEGRVCLGSLEIGSFDPPLPDPYAQPETG